MAGFSSCNNDKFLDVTHYSILPQESAYESDVNALASLTGCYDLVLPSNTSGHNDDPFKPYVWTSSHPTMDSQATGWDKDFMTQSWTADNEGLLKGWKHAYAGISRCNDFLAGLETSEGLSDDVKNTCEGEARALRGYHYFWLATTFGRVPMLNTGETYSNTPAKARAQTYEEMWDFIIEDFKTAADLLDWKPYANQYGRCTKGMALAYLGDCYMWKAYRTGDDALYNTAKATFKQILDQGPYKLNESFTTLYDADVAWNDEAIWQVVLNEGDQWGTWDGGKWSEAHGWVGYYFGPNANDAWGTYQVSYELYDAYEDGDRRRDGSLVCACIPESELEKIGKKDHWKQNFVASDLWMTTNADLLESADRVGKIDATNPVDNSKWAYNPNCPIGYNPFLQEVVGYPYFHRDPAEPAPTVYSTKHWRNGRNWWQNDQWHPDHIYWKRLANVYLDYAECCFRTGDATTGWQYVNKLRDRAFGKLEIGNKAKLTAKYGNYFAQLASYYSASAGRQEGWNGEGKYVDVTEYPYPFLEDDATVTVPDAETYYTQLKSTKGFTSEVWKVAVNEERRKELNAEWCLRGDLQKSGYLEDHIEHNYPKGYGTATGNNMCLEWHTYRNFDFDIRKMDMPIPADELIKNPLCDQNEAYR